jgi:hypothetical protein
MYSTAAAELVRFFARDAGASTRRKAATMAARLAMRRGVYSIAMALALVALAGATIARAQDAAVAATTNSPARLAQAAQSGGTASGTQSTQSTQSTQATQTAPGAQSGSPDTQSTDTSSLPAAANASAPNQAEAYEPIDGSGRVYWVMMSTIQPLRIFGDAVFASVQTGIDSPHEYGPHWDGFGRRLGIDLAGAAVSNTVEASLGAIWGEDPRYARLGEGGFGSRMKSVLDQTFTARRRDGEFHPAYARYIAVPSSNWLSNTWRAPSASNNKDAAIRSAWGFASRFGGNAYVEFKPDVRHWIFHRNE